MFTPKPILYWIVLLIAGACTAASVRAAETAPAEPDSPAAQNTAEKTGPAAPTSSSGAAQAGGASGEVDISDVENQYWKAHDKDFEVIQNKQYTKAGRVEVAPLFGIYQHVSYQDTNTLGAAASYHFNEVFGAEVLGYHMFSTDSLILSRFQQTTGSTVEFNQEHYYLAVGPVITPIYGKFSLLGKKIAHFDLYVTPNIGITRTNADRITPGVGVGEKFWISPNWNLRFEYRWMRYTDTVDTSQGSTAVKNGGSGTFTDTMTNQNIMLGVSYLFN